MQWFGTQHKTSRCASGRMADKVAKVVLDAGEVDEVEGIGEHDMEEVTTRLLPLDQQQAVDEWVGGNLASWDGQSSLYLAARTVAP